MNYPVWNVPVLSGGLVVAIIAITHVLISHFAVGGGAFIAVAEIWSDRQKDGREIRKWLHRFATFFLVFTTVFGAITGVGIWFSIQLASPEGTSLLIHQFVFAWAVEWVAFLVELSILYLYYYGWETNTRRMQVFLAIAYFAISWFSLVIINGILSFMLTPGAWTVENKDIFAGFFNPTYVPSLIVRTAVMFLIGGLGALLIASRIRENEDLKERIILFAVKWIVPAAILVPLATVWFWTNLPESSVKIFEAGAVGVSSGKLEAMARHFWLAVISGALIVLGALIISLRPRAVHFSAALALFLLALFGIMGAEFFREMARKPYVIHGVLYSNGLWKNRAEESGYLERPYFSETRWEPEDAKPLSAEHGEWMYRLQCASCHSLEGYRSLRQRTAQWTPSFGVRFLDKLDEQGVMPKFQGNLEDRAALTAFFMGLQRDKPVDAADVLAQVLEERRKKEEAEKKADEVTLSEKAPAPKDEATKDQEVRR